MVMLFTTLVTPVMSVASLVTRLFSASFFFAMPLIVTTLSVVVTFVLMALVERCASKDDLTFKAVMRRHQSFRPSFRQPSAGALAIVIWFFTSLMPSTSLGVFGGSSPSGPGWKPRRSDGDAIRH